MSTPNTELALPTIHLNGTSADNLKEGWERAYSAIGEAKRALQETVPNMRDYANFEKARNEHFERLQKLESVRQELVALCEGVDAQLEEGDQVQRAENAIHAAHDEREDEIVAFEKFLLSVRCLMVDRAKRFIKFCREKPTKATEDLVKLIQLLERAREFAVHTTCRVPEDNPLCVRARQWMKDADPHLFAEITQLLRKHSEAHHADQGHDKN